MEHQLAVIALTSVATMFDSRVGNHSLWTCSDDFSCIHRLILVIHVVM